MADLTTDELRVSLQAIQKEALAADAGGLQKALQGFCIPSFIIFSLLFLVCFTPPIVLLLCIEIKATVAGFDYCLLVNKNDNTQDETLLGFVQVTAFQKYM